MEILVVIGILILIIIIFIGGGVSGWFLDGFSRVLGLLMDGWGKLGGCVIYVLIFLFFLFIVFSLF